MPGRVGRRATLWTRPRYYPAILLAFHAGRLFLAPRPPWRSSLLAVWPGRAAAARPPRPAGAEAFWFVATAGGGAARGPQRRTGQVAGGRPASWSTPSCGPCCSRRPGSAPRARPGGDPVASLLVFLAGAALPGRLASRDPRRDRHRAAAPGGGRGCTRTWRASSARRAGGAGGLLADRKRDYVLAFPVSDLRARRRLPRLSQPAGAHHLGANGASRSSDALGREPARDPHHADALPPAGGFRTTIKLEELQPRLRDYCERHLVQVGTYRVPEEVRLYARIPQAEKVRRPLSIAGRARSTLQ